MVAEPRGKDSSMSSGSTESQYGLRRETAALWSRAGLKQRAVARLWANLQEPAKEIVRMCKPQDFADARGVERLPRILQESPLASLPVFDANKKIQAYDKISRRRRGHRRLHRERTTCFPR